MTNYMWHSVIVHMIEALGNTILLLLTVVLIIFETMFGCSVVIITNPSSARLAVCCFDCFLCLQNGVD